MAITRTAMIDDDGTGTTGTIINNAWKTELYNQIDAADAAGAGAWIVVPFNAANFTGASPLVWTVTAGQIQHNRYLVMGKTVIWSFYVYGSTTSGTTSSSLRVAIPFGTMKLPALVNPVAWLTDGVQINGFVSGFDATKVAINKGTLGNFAIVASGMTVAATIIYELA